MMMMNSDDDADEGVCMIVQTTQHYDALALQSNQVYYFQFGSLYVSIYFVQLILEWMDGCVYE